MSHSILPNISNKIHLVSNSILIQQFDGSIDEMKSNDKRSRKHKKEKKDKKKRKKLKKWKKKIKESSSEESESDKEKTCQEKSSVEQSNKVILQRDSWMLEPADDGFKSITNNQFTFQRAKLDKKKESRKSDDFIVRELNPYWKDGGIGLPPEEKTDKPINLIKSKFQRPGSQSPNTLNSSSFNYNNESSSDDETKSTPNVFGCELPKEKYNVNTDSLVCEISEKSKSTAKNCIRLSRTEMNHLSAKILKAELMGDEDEVITLKKQLDEANSFAKFDKEENKTVILTKTDRHGNVRPLKKQNYDDTPNQWSKKRKKAMETHASGMRKIYFADDNKYSLKELVEQEKFNDENPDESMAKFLGKKKRRDSLDDDFMQGAAKQYDNEGKERRKAEKQSVKQAAVLESCKRCLPNSTKELMISFGNNAYLSLPYHTSITDGHCFIIPNAHYSAATALDEDVWNEIQDFRKSIVAMCQKQDEDVIFMETNLKPSHHMAIECVPVPKEIGDMAPIYFKKALMEVGPEWAQNKRIVDLKKGIRNSVPKGFAYFAVDFGTSNGYAHVIEDVKSFPSYFGREIIAGMMDLEPKFWRKPKAENKDELLKKVDRFAESYKEYDITV